MITPLVFAIYSQLSVFHLQIVPVLLETHIRMTFSDFSGIIQLNVSKYAGWPNKRLTFKSIFFSLPLDHL